MRDSASHLNKKKEAEERKKKKTGTIIESHKVAINPANDENRIRNSLFHFLVSLKNVLQRIWYQDGGIERRRNAPPQVDPHFKENGFDSNDIQIACTVKCPAVDKVLTNKKLEEATIKLYIYIYISS